MILVEFVALERRGSGWIYISSLDNWMTGSKVIPSTEEKDTKRRLGFRKGKEDYKLSFCHV